MKIGEYRNFVCAEPEKCPAINVAPLCFVYNVMYFL